LQVVMSSRLMPQALTPSLWLRLWCEVVQIVQETFGAKKGCGG
jgi:hypothetical protein